MSHTAFPDRANRRLLSIAWLPAILLIAAGLIAATGYSITPTSKAASSGTTNVDATVQPELQIGGTCIGASVTGSLSVGADDTNIGASACTVTYSTNNHTPGVRLRVESSRPSGVALCQNSTRNVACGAVPTFLDAPTGGIADMADGAFGVRVDAAPTCTTSAGSWANGTTYGLPDSSGLGSVVCAQHNMGSAGSYSLRFRADTLAAQASGTYYAQATFMVEAI